MSAGYSGRPVLVVGGLGYIGQHLSGALVDGGARVIIVTPVRERHEAAAAHLESRGARIIEADVREPMAMREAVRGQAVVFALSGRSGAVRSVHDPIGDLEVNCTGTLSLLEAIRADNPGAKLVFAASRLVYGAVRTVPVTEDVPVAPLCPHGAHKAMAEQYLAIYGRLHGVSATSLRITNPYGPGQPTERSAYGVINFLIHRALHGQTLPIYGDGTQLRDYVFIDDVVGALLRAGLDARSGVYNVGSGVGTAMIDAAQLIVETAGAGRVELVEWPPLAREIETGDFIADVRRIRDELGWQPAVDFAAGLRRTIAASAAAEGDRG